ncbi:MAG TPA: TolC family protein [Limnobacter sp.]|nr:TolC family protein [Limnobacter sp.]
MWKPSVLISHCLNISLVALTSFYASPASAQEYTLAQALEQPTVAQPAPNTLTLAQALLLAQQRSEALRAQDEAVRAAQSQSVAAFELPDPMLMLEVSNIPVNGPDQFSLAADFMTMRGVGVSQTFTREGKRLAQVDVFNKSAEFEQTRKWLALSQLRTGTAQAFLDQVYLQAMLGLLKAQRSELALQIEAADALYRSGKGSQIDLFAARTELGMLDVRIQDTLAQLDNAGAELQRWVGDIGPFSVDGAVDLSRSRLQGVDLSAHLTQHPEVLALDKLAQQFQAQAQLKEQEKTADWTLSVMYAGRGPAFSEMLTLGASRPLFVDEGNRQDQAVVAAQAMVAKAQAERLEMLRMQVLEARRWQQTWTSNLKRLRDFNQSLIPLTQQRTQAALAAYRGNVGSLNDVLAARRMEIDMRMEKLRIEMETARIWAQLEYLIPAEVQR